MRVPRAFLCAISLLAAGSPVEASLAPRTGDVLVSTYTSGSRAQPSVTTTAGGQFLVVWQDTRPDVEGTHIIGRKLDPDGTLLGTEFQIDGAGSAVARAPSIVASGDGEFTVVWRSDPNDGERARLLARRIDENGAAIGTEFQVNSPRTLEGDYYLSDPATAPAAENDGFVVVWASGIRIDSLESYGPATEIYERRFFSNATPLGFDEIVSQPDVDPSVRAEIAPDVAALAGGGFVVAWAKGYFSGYDSAFQAIARPLFPSGQPTGSEIVAGTGGAVGPRVGARDPAGFSVAWSTYAFVDYIPHGGGETVARTFDAARQPLSEPFTVSSPAGGSAGNPPFPYAGVEGIAAGSSTAGEFVVAWTSGTSYFEESYGGSSDGDRSGIFARPFGRDDLPSGRERQANATGEHDQKNPDLAFADADALAIVWDSNEDDDFTPDRVYARVFDLITPECGDGDEDGTSGASDALFVLQAAVGARSCAACLCDVNSSNALTAADALIVLRASVGTGSGFTCPPCAPPSVGFAVQSDAVCWGAHVEVPAEAVPSGALDQGCTAHPSLALLGCTAAFTVEGGALTFDARGCFLDPGELFSCAISQEDAAALARASSTSCGCGCADTCPGAPVLCADTENGGACATPATVVAITPGAVHGVAGSFTTTSGVQGTVTSSTTCGTCCDFYDDGLLELESDVVVTELQLRFDSGRDPSCFEDVSCSFDAAADGPTYARFEEDGNTVDVCLSDVQGIDGPLPLGQCSVLTGFIAAGPTEIVRALGADLKPIVPAPVVSIE